MCRITNYVFFLFQLNISFNDKTEVFEYPSFESVSSTAGQEEVAADTSEKENEEATHNKQQNIFKANTAVGSSGKKKNDIRWQTF